MTIVSRIRYACSKLAYIALTRADRELGMVLILSFVNAFHLFLGVGPNLRVETRFTIRRALSDKPMQC
jgi:hypothetical protein